MNSEKTLLQRYYSIVPWEHLINTILGHEDELPYVDILFFYKNENGVLIPSHYNTFHSVFELREYIRCRPPYSIHLGQRTLEPVNVKERRTMYRSDLVFDYDISPRGNICNCSEKQMCPLCWKNIVIPDIQKLIRCLVEKGFKKIFAVFSGRRGVHVWVVGKEVRMYREQARETLINNIASSCGVNLDRGASSLTHAIKIPYSIHHDTLQASLPFDPFDDKWKDIWPQISLDVFNVNIDENFLIHHFPIKFVEIDKN